MRAAVIGLGSQYGLGTQHSTAYDQRPEIDHIMLCDIHRDVAESAAAGLTKPTSVFTGVEEMFAKEHVDVASILTPDHLHRAHAEAAFAAGAHVLLTKPIAPRLPDARAIVQGAAAVPILRRLSLLAHRPLSFPRPPTSSAGGPPVVTSCVARSINCVWPAFPGIRRAFSSIRAARRPQGAAAGVVSNPLTQFLPADLAR